MTLSACAGGPRVRLEPPQQRGLRRRSGAGLLALAALLLAGCRKEPPPAASPPPACALPGGIDAGWLAPGAVLLLGEVHHTVECPRFAGAVLCAAAASGPVILGVELDAAEQPRIDAFLAGGPAAQLVAGAFWQRVPGDGRETEAMLELLTRARELRRAGRALWVVAMDSAPEDRDLGMARVLLAARAAHPEATTVVLVGNLHARRARAMRAPLALRLQQAEVPLVSVNLGAGAPEGYDALLDLGAFTTSPPARAAFTDAGP